jgi:hypothetical protein
MKKLLLILGAALLISACGESHTYKGMMIRTDMFHTESEVDITITKTSDTEGTMVVKGSGGTMFEQCTNPIKLNKESGGWSPTDCYLKGEFGADSRTVNGFIEIKDKSMEWNGSLYNTTDHSTIKYEFIGREY